MRVQFAGLTLSLPEGWCDITEDLEPGVPYTLARSGAEAVGALQFSVALYNGGAEPTLTREHLNKFLIKLFDEKQLGAPINIVTGSNSGMYVRADSYQPSDFYRVWYISDGMNVALITYTATEVGDTDRNFLNELAEVDTIIQSIQFSD